MTRSNSLLAAIVLAATAMWGACGNAPAQTWHRAKSPENTSNSDNSVTTDSDVTPVSWDQRVLRRPPSQLQWQPTQRTAASYSQPVTRSQPVIAAQALSSPRQSASRYQTAQRPSYDEVFGTSSVAKPVVEPSPQVAVDDGQPLMAPDTTQFEPMAVDGAFAGPADCASCGEPDGACGSCAPCGETCDYGYELFDGRCGRWLRDLSVFAGGDAFKGPLDHGRNGNFGLHEGLNFSGPLGDPWGCGYQIGANFVQSNFSGTTAVTIDDHNIRAADRHQYFLTAGIFRRAICGGLQGGVAFDYLRDDYYDNSDLKQIRSETALVLDDVYEIGYYGAYGVGTDRVIDGRLDPTDMFVAFVRRNFENGGDGRIWGGATGNGDGLLGADLWVPLGRGFALENRINYLIPKEGRGETAQSQESWGLVIQLVWYPGQTATCQHKNPFRALFDVADNSLFMVDRLTNHQ